MRGGQIETSVRMVEVDEPIKVHAQTWMVVISINFLYFCQLTAIVGSGLLAQPVSVLFDAPTQAVWFSQVLNILTVAVCPIISQTADYWGRKWFLVILGAMGFVGAIITSRAESIGAVIAGFTIIGINFGSQSILVAVVSEILPRKHRPFAQATINMSAGGGGFVGLIMGGTLLRHGDNTEAYRIYFYVNAAMYGLATIGCLLFYNPPPRELQVVLTNSAKLRRLDWVGYILFAPGLTLFCMALSWFRNPYQWTNVHILAPFITGVVITIAFCVYEWRFQKCGILHHDLFQNRNFTISLLSIFVEGLSFFTANAYFTFQVSLFTGADLLIAALHFSLFFLVATPVAFLSGVYSARWKSVRLPSVIGFTFILIFNILMITTTPSSPKTAYWGYPIFAGVGLGSILPTVMVTAQLSTPPSLISLVSGLVTAFRGIGGTVGLALNNAIFNEALSTEIPAKIAAAALPLGLPASSLGPLIEALTGNQAALQKVPGVTQEIIIAAGAALKEAYHIGFRNCWIAAACFCFVAVISSLFIFDPHEEFNAHIDAPAEAELVELQKHVGAIHLENIPVCGEMNS